MGASTAAFALLPGASPRILVYDPRASKWSLYVTQGSVVGGSIFASAGQGQWQSGIWPRNQDGGPWDRQIIGLEDGQLLDRDLGDGSTRIWSVVDGAADSSPVTLVPSPSLMAGPEESFRRGHRLVHLGPGRLLEWLPRTDAERLDPSNPAAGSAFRVWSYSLQAGDGLDFRVVSSGSWPDLGGESDVFADGDHLFVWTRGTGRLRAYAIDPSLADPLSGPPTADSPPNPILASQDWNPPTQAPSIKHLLVILQDGRSFDSYFGRACQGPAGAGDPVDCATGAPWCCEAMPTSVPGAAACTDPDSDPTYHPVDTPTCMSAKIDGGLMDGFAVAHPPGKCGDPRDFACAGAGPGDLLSGSASTYRSLAESGALADRFFQTYAFEEGDAPDPGGVGPLIENLLYLVSARFAAIPPLLIDTPLLTKELARLQVSWAIYASPAKLALLTGFGVPIFYDPDWFPYRSLGGDELEHDLAVGTLPAVAVALVLSDGGNPALSPAAGPPFDPAPGYVQSLVQAVAASPRRDDTLVLVAHLTAGGTYDHVPPPASPPLTVDSSTGSATQAVAIHYGPRVPLLAVGRFARRAAVSHVQLELTSITRFVEWNWLHGLALKGGREGNDLRRYRDTTASNLGSLLDIAEVGVDVPAGAD
jgi:phospholipase C